MQIMYEIFRDNLKYPTYRWMENISYKMHFHSSIELLYVVQGRVKAVLNGTQYTVEKDQVLIVSSYTAHFYKSEEPSHAIMLIVPLDFVAAYSAILSQKVFSQCVCANKDMNREILHCMKKLLTYPECRKETENIIKGYICVIIGLLINEVGLTDILDRGSTLSKEILMYLEKNYLSPVSLDILSHDFGYSKYRFSHIFSANFGCGLTEYVNNLRARHAANQLITSDSALIDIAMDSGFESMRTFYRSFKRCFGVSPSQYRSGYIEAHNNHERINENGNEN